MLHDNPNGLLFIVSAPSGVGKTTLIRAAMKRRPETRFSVSSTTRPPRNGEKDGEDYHFLDRSEFMDGIKQGRFLEWAEVHGHYYGTGGEQVRAWLAGGMDVILDIDVQGARQVRCFYPDVHTLFILPPSFEELKRRLSQRGTESDEQLTMRLTTARKEIQNASWYDYLVVNEVLEEAVEDFVAILRSCHRRTAHVVGGLRELILS